MACPFLGPLFCTDGKGWARASAIIRALSGGSSKAVAAFRASIGFYELYVSPTLKAIIASFVQDLRDQCFEISSHQSENLASSLSPPDIGNKELPRPPRCRYR